MGRTFPANGGLERVLSHGHVTNTAFHGFSMSKMSIGNENGLKFWWKLGYSVLTNEEYRFSRLLNHVSYLIFKLDLSKLLEAGL